MELTSEPYSLFTDTRQFHLKCLIIVTGSREILKYKLFRVLDVSYKLKLQITEVPLHIAHLQTQKSMKRK